MNPKKCYKKNFSLHFFPCHCFNVFALFRSAHILVLSLIWHFYHYLYFVDTLPSCSVMNCVRCFIKWGRGGGGEEINYNMRKKSQGLYFLANFWWFFSVYWYGFFLLIVRDDCRLYFERFLVHAVKSDGNWYKNCGSIFAILNCEQLQWS